MSIIEKHKEKKKNHEVVKFIINSDIDYHDHDLNILKACLNKWAGSSDLALHTTLFKFDWMYANTDTNERLYFISTNIGQLKRCNMEHIIGNPYITASNYMNSSMEKIIYTDYVES